MTNFKKFAKLSDHTEIAYISAKVWSSFAYKTNKMAVSEMLEENQCVTDWSVKNNSKGTLSEKNGWYFNIFANQFRTIQSEKWFGREKDSSSTELTVSCIFLKLAWT